MSFFAFPKSSPVIKSPLLASLLTRISASSVNSPKTLPQIIPTKAELYDEIYQNNPKANSISLKMKQSMGYAKSIGSFYKNGVTNVWNNKSALNQILKSIKLTNHVNNRGKVVDIKVPNWTKLTEEMSQGIYMSKIENTNDDSIVRHDTDISPLFSLKRAEYQLIRRTGADFYKIPIFGLIFLVFMEFTPVICLIFPNVAPLTCILPATLPKVWKVKNRPMEDSEQEISDLAVKNAYNLSTSDLRLLCSNLRLNSKYIPYPEGYLRNQLQQYYNYITVDNFYLAGLNGGGNIWNLTNDELTLACLERNMIKDLKDIDFGQLRLELFRFIVNFETNNVGYLLAQHGIEKVKSDELEWLL